ncbi:hypothetical protein ZWY2020_020350 [Hordeum vulgare]|nr:hypothetical protein ZWY2020_020350 [Hordeum vulgare]
MLRDESPRMKVIGASEMHRMDGDDNNGGGHSHKVDTVEVRARAEAWTDRPACAPPSDLRCFAPHGDDTYRRRVVSPESATMAALPLAMAEVYDAYSHLITGDELRALQPIFKIYGRRQVFTGPIVTLKVFEDNVVVREFLEEKGQGRVLVVEGGGSLRCSILHGTKGGGARCCASHPEVMYPLSIYHQKHRVNLLLLGIFAVAIIFFVGLTFSFNSVDMVLVEAAGADLERLKSMAFGNVSVEAGGVARPDEPTQGVAVVGSPHAHG